MTRSRLPAPRRLRRALVPLLAAALVLAACSDDGDGGAGGDPSASAGRVGGGVGRDVVLAGLADDVIVPAYEDLASALERLEGRVGALCATPSAEALEGARAAWRAAAAAWPRARPGGVGPAMERRLMSAVGFTARPGTIDDLLAGTDPVDPEALLRGGAVIRGLYAEEHALFGEGSDALVGSPGARRCTYAASVASLAADAAAEVRDDWTGGFRDEFAAGIGGEQQESVAELLNEVTNRLRELDELGLRDLAEAASLDDLAESRLDGPAAYAMAQRRALLDGVAALLGGSGEGIVALVAERSPETADRLVEATATTVDAFEPLPDSVAEAFGQGDRVRAAADAVAALKVLLATEAASQLGVTITFSDSDGDA